MFLSKEELGSVIYSYEIDLITGGNDEIINEAIATSITEVQSYLTGNRTKDSFDGRIKYDVAVIFSKTGNDRNAMLLATTKTVAKWWLVQLCNADIIYEQAKERYDRSISWLNKLAKGEITLLDLPIETPTNTTDTPTTNVAYGSRQKFNHE